MGYARQVLSGFSWLIFLKFFGKGLGFVKLFFLARLLTPADFGLFGIVAILLALSEVLTETGINPFLIQETKKPSKYYSTAWIVSIIRGALISLVLIAASFIIPPFYNESNLFQLFMIAASIPLIRGFINPAVIMFQRNLEFHKDVYLRLVTISVDVVVSIVAAIYLRSPIAFVIGQIASSITEVALTWLLISPKPRFSWKTSQFLEVVKFGKWINLSIVLGYLAGHLDDIIVSIMIGTKGLGLYQTAYKLTQTTAGELGDLGAQAIYPAISRIRNDLQRLKRSFALSVGGISLLLVAPTAFLFLFGNWFVRLALGEQWLEIVPILPLMVLAAYLQAINRVIFPFHLVQNRARRISALLMVYLVLMVGFLIPLASTHGILGAAWAILIARVLFQPFVYFTIRKSFNESSLTA